MATKDILIVVKTYPEISRKHTETVCTAGILADTKTLVRLYPIRFRYLEGAQRFKKYQWIQASISKATSDPRPESHTIDLNSIRLGPVLPPGKQWRERRSWLLNEKTVFESVEQLRATQTLSGASLGIVKPKTVKRVIIQERDKQEVAEAIAKKDSIIKQLDLFEEKKDLYIVPVRIMLEFFCHDSSCTGHTMSILDWEFGQLYRRVRGSADWREKIQARIMNEIFDGSRDSHIMLGNMAGHPQTFCILGFFWPKKPEVRQMPLF